MKKGFTLIELLAVIIILAIVALIATPMVLNVVDDVKKSAAETEARMVVKSVNLYCESANFKATQDAEYINPCADKEISAADLKLMVDNGNFTSATVTYDGAKVTGATIVSNGHTVTYANGSYTSTKGTTTTEPTTSEN